MNTNLFENAQFGDEFIRRDRKTARYCGRSNEQEHVLEVDGDIALYADDGNRLHKLSIFQEQIIARKDDDNTKVIYISLPITGHEDTYNERLTEAVDWCKEIFPNSDIITPKKIADDLDGANKELEGSCFYQPLLYEDYLLEDVRVIIQEADTVLMCDGWMDSRGCRMEHGTAKEWFKRIIYK